MLTVALLLLIQLIAMQFTDEVNWTLSDFLVAGVLLLGTGLMCELVLRKVNDIRLRIAICVALLAMLLVVWAGTCSWHLRDTARWNVDSTTKKDKARRSQVLSWIFAVPTLSNCQTKPPCP